jgi:hypothetical protein
MLPGDDLSAAQLEMDGAWLTFSRARARGRLVLIAKAACEDASGRRVESAIVPVAIPWARGRWPVGDRRFV